MIKMEESAKFAKLEHLSSYSAAEALGSGDLERVSYYPRKGWFVTRWQATILVIAITLFIFTVVYMVRPANQNDQRLNESNNQRYQYHRNVTEAMHDLPYLGLLDEDKMKYVRYRRPTDEDLLKFLVEPIHYNVRIKSLPNFRSILTKEFDFEGEVIIDLHTRENIDYLLIGASEIQAETPTVQRKIPDDSRARANDIEVDAIHHQAGLIRIDFKEPLEPSTIYELKMSYRGKIRSLPYGIFYMIDRDPDTLQENFLIATNSDTPYARTIFPCFDAREQNATYEISILQDQEKHFESSVLANWESESTSDEQIWQRCNVTQPMRTENFQFVVTSYHEQSIMTPDLQHFSIWTTTEQKDSVSYILDIGIKLIEDLQVYFDVPLPASKVDIFALPQQIPYLKSKMGMIYTPESNVLYTQNKNSERQKRQMGLVIAAHIAEQWIESIITFTEDEDEWLKEALVEYLKYKILSFVEPEWKLEAEFYSNVQQIEMQNDISHYIAQKNRNSRYHVPRYSFPVRKLDIPIKPRSSPKNDNSDVGFYETAEAGIYNRLHRPKLSSKGACILRMLQHMVTEPIFRISLTLFLEKSKSEDVSIHDFWSIVSTEVENAHQLEYQLLPEGVSLNSIMNTWTENDGYPILNVDRDYDDNTIRFSQLHFLAMQGRRDAGDELVHWYIPISYTTEKESYFSATAPRIWLGKTNEKTIDNPSNLNGEQWLLVNPQQTGFYRVNYDKNNWNMLKKSLHNKEFPPMIRAQLFDDALYFGRKGMLDYAFALNLTLYLGDFTETDYTVWKSALRHLNYIQNLLIHADDNSGGKYESKIYESFKIYVKWLIESAFHGIGILDQDNLLLRPDIFLWACATDVKACKERAEKDFNSWKESEDPDENNPIDPDLRYALLCSVMRYGRKDDFDFLIDRYMNALAVNPDKYEYLKSLFCYPEEEEINRVLNMTLSPGYSEILLAQIQQIWSAAGETFFPTEVPFQYLIKNWEEIENKYSDFHIIITAIVKNSTNNIYTILSRDTLKTFREEQANQLTYLEKILKTATKAIDDKITWKTSRIDDLASWLKSNISYFKERRFADYD